MLYRARTEDDVEAKLDVTADDYGSSRHNHSGEFQIHGNDPSETQHGPNESRGTRASSQSAHDTEDNDSDDAISRTHMP